MVGSDYPNSQVKWRCRNVLAPIYKSTRNPSSKATNPRCTGFHRCVFPPPTTCGISSDMLAAFAFLTKTNQVNKYFGVVIVDSQHRYLDRSRPI